VRIWPSTSRSAGSSGWTSKHPLHGEQFLVYKILDAMTQTFFPVLTRIDDDIDDIEQQVIVTRERRP
jgi:Mg2+ and Co2+ transporter CorA